MLTCCETEVNSRRVIPILHGEEKRVKRDGINSSCVAMSETLLTNIELYGLITSMQDHKRFNKTEVFAILALRRVLGCC